jgi:anti-sigma factor RsiW
MNCRSAHPLLSAERDGALASHERAALETHLADCADCRRARVNVAAAVEHWRANVAAAKAPDATLAWQAVRRELRATTGRRESGAPWFVSWMLPLGGAAALAAAVAIALVPQWRGGLGVSSPMNATTMATARAEFVEVPGNASSMVYVDDPSGWLVVWAVDDANSTKVE